MFQLSNVQEYITIDTCWSVYKAEMQNVKVVYFTESTIAAIAKYFTFFLQLNCQFESMKFGCPGNACDEHFLEAFVFKRT